MDTVRIEAKGDIVLLSLLEEFDHVLTEDLKNAANKALQSFHFTHLVIGLTDVQTINSSGIGLLVSIKTKCISQQKKLYLLNASDQIMKTLTITQMLSFFNHIHSLNDIPRIEKA